MIALDYGTHKTGIAYAVEGFAFPYKTVPTSELLDFLGVYVPERDARSIILGMPYNIDGTVSRHARRVLTFEKILQKSFPDIKIILHDERLTTSEAKLAGVDDIDAESARLILEDYIESQGV